MANMYWQTTLDAKILHTNLYFKDNWRLQDLGSQELIYKTIEIHYEIEPGKKSTYQMNSQNLMELLILHLENIK